jgi:diacylglycerol kinase family enzyme
VRAAVASSTATPIDVRPTYSAGDAKALVLTELAASDAGARPPVRTVVAGGGDGTLCEVVQALREYEQQKGKKTAATKTPPPSPQLPSLAMLLAGTANDLGSACGVSADPLEALRLAADPSRARPIDLAFCNGFPFVNVATAGPISSVSSAGMSETIKRLLGPLSVPVAGLMQLLTPARRHSLKPQPVTLIFPTARDVPEPPLPGMTKARVSAEAEEVAAAAASAVKAAGAAAAGEAEAAIAAVAGPPEGAKQEGNDGGGNGGGAGTSTDVVLLPPPPGAAGAAAAGRGKVMAVRGALAALAVGQSRQMGRLVNVCPEALLDDGLIDCTVLFAPSLGAAAADFARDALSAVAEAAVGPAPPSSPPPASPSPPKPVPLAGLCTLRVPWLHVTLEQEDEEQAPRASFGAASDAATAAGAVAAAPSSTAAIAPSSTEAPSAPLLMANLDGEPLVQARALRFSVLPRAVRLHLPDERLLVAGLNPEAAVEGEEEEGDDDKASARREALELAAREVAVDFGADVPPSTSHHHSRGAAARLRRRLARPLARLRGGRASSRAELLRALLRAKQPPGRMARALPVLLMRLRVALVALALVAFGALLGSSVAAARARG